MNAFFFFRACGMAFLLLMAPFARGTEVVWTNVSGGDWNTATNWSPNQVPTGSDDAVITNAGTYAVSISANASAGTLTVGASSGTQSLALTSGTLTLNGSSVFGSNVVFTMTAGTLAGSGDVTITGTLNWVGGDMAGSGTTVLGANAVATCAYITMGRRFDNYGTMTLQAGGGMVGEYYGPAFVFNNYSTFNVVGDGSQIHEFGSTGGALTISYFNNFGIFNKNGTAPVLFRGRDYGNGWRFLAFVNQGTLNLNAGSIEFRDQGHSTTTTLNVPAGATLTLSQGAGGFGFGPGAGLSGSGAINFQAGTLNFPVGTFTANGILNFNGATVTLNDPITPGGLSQIRGSVTFNDVLNTNRVQVAGNVTFGRAQTFQSFIFSGGTVTGTNDLTITGALTWANGSMDGSGKTVLGTNATASCSYLTLSRRFDNYGTVTLLDGGAMLPVYYEAAFEFNNYGVFNVEGNGSQHSFGSPGYGGGLTESHFNNFGVFNKNGSSRAQFMGRDSGNQWAFVEMVNSGTVNVNGGALAFTGSGNSLDFPATNGLTSQLGTTFELGAGSLTGSTTNIAQFAPQGRVLFDGGGAQQLEVMSRDLGNAALGFSNNFAYGTIELSGSVNLSLVNNFTNSSGNEALYVNNLIVGSGCTLNLNGLNGYVRASHVSGTLTGGSLIPVSDRAGPIALNTITNGAIAVAGSVDQWTFFAHAGETVTVALQTAGGSLPAPQLTYADVRLVSPLGTVLAGAINSTAGQAVLLANVPLATDGTYRLLIQSPASQASSSGNYQFAVWEVTPTFTPLVFNNTMYGRIGTPYSVDNWTFSAPAGTSVQFNLLNTNGPGVVFTLAGPNSWLGFTNITGSSGLVTLPSSGSYTLSATGTGAGYNIAYAFQLVQTIQTDLSLGTNYTGHFAGSEQAQIFKLVLTNGMPVLVQLNSLLGQGWNELYISRGLPPTRTSYDYMFGNVNSANQQILVPFAGAGTWYVLVYGNYVPTPTDFTLSAIGGDIIVQSVFPTNGAAGSLITLTVQGGGFYGAMQAQLVGTNGTVILPASQDVDSLQQITATFNLTNQAPGLYSLVVSRTGSATNTLLAVFEVLQPGVAKLETQLILPGVLGRHMPATFYIEYQNSGTASMPAPLIQLRPTDQNSGVKPILTLDSSRVGQGLWTSVLPDGCSLSVTILGSGRQPGILNPGEKIRVPVYYCGLLTPWPADLQVKLGLAVFEASSSEPMNWEGITYGQITYSYAYCWTDSQNRTTCVSGEDVSRAETPWVSGQPPTAAELQQMWGLGPLGIGGIRYISGRWDEPGVLGLRPDSINPDAWNAMVLNLRGSVGETMGGYIAALSRNAQFLARAGQPTSDIGKLWRFEVLKAGGLGPVSVLDSATDANMVTPGVGLAISRSFPNSISGRSVLGPFGYGWTMGWNLVLTEATNGLVTIGSCCGGNQRSYYPDTRNPGSYLSMAGDAKSLKKVGAGVFELHDPNGTIARFAGGGVLAAVVDPNGNQVSVSRDGSGRIQTLAHSCGASLSVAYNGSGYISAIWDSAGRTNTYGYDASGNHLSTVTSDDGKVMRYQYVTSGDPRVLHTISSVERGGTTQNYTYDSNGRLQSAYKTGGEELVTFAYADDGTVLVSDNLGTNRLYYNDSGFLAKVMDPLGNISMSSFDGNSRLVRSITPSGETKTFAWSDLGQLTRQTDEMGHATGFAYNGPTDRLSSFTDANGNTTRYTYDNQGNLLGTIYPNLSVEQFGQYAAGLPLGYTNRRSQPLTYQYNPAGQVTGQIFADGTSNTFAFDVRGNLTNVIEYTSYGTNRATSYTYGYSTDGDRLKRVSYPNGRFLQYAYDNFGRRTQMTDQDGYATKYEYDSAGRLWKLRDESNNLLVAYTYDPAGRLSRIDRGNGTFTTYEYDAAGQILNLKNHRDATTLNSRFDYTYDRRGRRTSMDTLDGTWTYSYDDIGELTRAVFLSFNTNIPNQDLAYDYDAMGNRGRAVENGVTNVYMVNNLNQYASIGTNLQYDTDGNLTQDQRGHYSYDALDRITAITAPGLTANFGYDALGRRVLRTINGAQSEVEFDPVGTGDPVLYFSPDGTDERRYYFGTGLAAAKSGSGTEFFEADANGAIVGVLGPGGTATYSYDPFGQTMPSQTAGTNRFQFMGDFGVESIGAKFYLSGQRLLLPAIGRFGAVDPARFGSPPQNLYNYARNDPVDLVDPGGDLFMTARGAYNLWKKYEKVKKITDRLEAIHTLVYGSCEDIFELAGSTAGSAGFGAGGVVLGSGLGFELGLGAAGIGAIPGAVIGAVTVGAALEEFGDWFGGSVGRAIGNQVCPLIDPKPQRLPPNIFTTNFVVVSTDPNMKIGPLGFGANSYVRLDKAFSYHIKFENLGSGSVSASGTSFSSNVWATAPAQGVDITDQLSTNLNWSTFRLTGFGFGATIVGLEQPSSSYQTVLPVTINGSNFNVNVHVSLDPSTGILRAGFQSIDPRTSLPPGVFTGFLPPEDGTGIGQGFIDYTVEPLPGLPTGTQIGNVALISFDRQRIISTDQIDPTNPGLGADPTKQALATIDNSAPASAVSALSQVQTNQDFIVCWGGADQGAGVATFDVFVRTNSGPWSLWVGETTNTCGPFHGNFGNSYSFFTQARDFVGNIEAAKTIADATTTVLLQLSPVFQSVTHPGSLILFTWSSIDGRTYQLQYSPTLASATWTNLGSSIIATNSSVSASDSITSDRQRFYRVILLP